MAYAHDDEEEIQVLGLVGPGNNGGDTLVALARLAEKGWTARAYLVRRKLAGDILIKRLEEAEGEVYQSDKDENFQQLQAFLESTDVVLDGVLGTGFKLPLKTDIGSVLAAVQGIVAEMEWPPYIIAVDCPSGIDCDTGQAAPKPSRRMRPSPWQRSNRGLLKLPAYDLIGELRVVEIGHLGDLKAWQAIKE